VINPPSIANFTKLSLRKTKADRKDAMSIAQFLLVHQETISQLSLSQELQDFRDIARERESVGNMLIAHKVEIKRLLQTTFPELERIRKSLSSCLRKGKNVVGYMTKYRLNPAPYFTALFGCLSFFSFRSFACLIAFCFRSLSLSFLPPLSPTVCLLWSRSYILAARTECENAMDRYCSL